MIADSRYETYSSPIMKLKQNDYKIHQQNLKSIDLTKKTPHKFINLDYKKFGPQSEFYKARARSQQVKTKEKQQKIQESDAKMISQLQAIKSRKLITTQFNKPKLNLSKFSQSVQYKQKIHAENNFIGNRILNKTSNLGQDKKFIKQIMINKNHASKKQKHFNEQPYIKQNIFPNKNDTEEKIKQSIIDEEMSYQLADSVLKHTIQSVYEKTQRRETQSREMTRNKRINTQIINTQLNRIQTIHSEFQTTNEQQRNINKFQISGNKQNSYRKLKVHDFATQSQNIQLEKINVENINFQNYELQQLVQANESKYETQLNKQKIDQKIMRHFIEQDKHIQQVFKQQKEKTPQKIQLRTNSQQSMK